MSETDRDMFSPERVQENLREIDAVYGEWLKLTHAAEMEREVRRDKRTVEDDDPRVKVTSSHYSGNGMRIRHCECGRGHEWVVVKPASQRRIGKCPQCEKAAATLKVTKVTPGTLPVGQSKARGNGRGFTPHYGYVGKLQELLEDELVG